MATEWQHAAASFKVPRIKILMTVTGNTFPASDRVMSIMENSAIMTSPDRQCETRERDGVLHSESPQIGAHFFAAAEILELRGFVSQRVDCVTPGASGSDT